MAEPSKILSDLVFLAIIAQLRAGAAAGGPLPPFSLKCNGNPVGLSENQLGRLQHLHLFATDHAVPLFSWSVAHSDRGARQNAYQVVVSGDPWLSEIVWDSGVVPRADSSVRYAGPPLRSGRLHFWSVRWWDDDGREARSLEIGHFLTGLMDPAEWSIASWIAAPDPFPTLPSISKTFTLLSKSVSQATFFVSGLGYSKVFVNGVDLNGRADPPIALNPGWTNYEVRVPYTAYVVTEEVAAFNPVNVEVLLGIGWRDTTAYPPKDLPNPVSDSVPRVLRAILTINYTDGSSQTIATDDTWSVSATPYNNTDSIYNGETYDARAVSGAPSLTAAVVTQGPGGQMYLPAIPYIAEMETDPAISVYRLTSDPSKQIVDFGYNSAGVCKINVLGLPSGTTVQIRHAEVQQHPPYGTQDGSLYYDNLRSAKQTDVYVGNGTGSYYQPAFTYHGFRYAEVSGYPRDLQTSDIAKVNVHSNLQPNGQLHTTDPVVLAIQAIAVRGQLSNLMSVPTDCDQRDERLGWMGDAGLSSDSMLLNFHMEAFLPHYAVLMADDQEHDDQEQDSLPDVVPFYRYGSRPADPSWGAAFPQLVWALYHYYGDLETAKSLYPAVLEYVRFVQRAIPASGIGNLYGYYGDWVPPPPQPKVGISFTSAFSFLLNVKQTIELAKALGYQDDVDNLTALFSQQSEAFNKAFFDGTAYTSGLQISYVLPLFLGIVPPDAFTAVVNKFLNQLTGSDQMHVTAGIIGTKFLLPVLTQLNRLDLALEIVRQTDYPSWGFMIYNNVEPGTTVWELWDGHIGSAGMDSRNHHMFSSVSGWLMTDMVGLAMREGSHGFDELELHPARYLDLSSAAVSLRHPKPVHFSWRRDGGLQCVKAPEDHAYLTQESHKQRGLKVSCGLHGGIMVKVLFASFGNPTGTCGSYTPGACHDPRSQVVVEDLCLGKNECEVPTDPRSWTGAPCDGASRWLTVSVQCATASPSDGDEDGNHLFSVISANLSIPVGSEGSLYLPAHGSGHLKVWEGQRLVWDDQGFVSGTDGVSSGKWVRELDAIRFEIPAGTYSFTVLGSAPSHKRCASSRVNDSSLSLSCEASGAVVTTIDWASYGNPAAAAEGDCLLSRALGDCHAGSSRSVVERFCLGRPSCSLPLSDEFFGSSTCDGIARKRLVVEYTCNARPDV